VIDNSLKVQQFGGPVVRVLPGKASFSRGSIFYVNDDWLWFETPNNQTSRIVVRMDRKKQAARIQAIPTAGWRHWLERLYNWLTHRYEDIPLAIVNCRDWQVTEVVDIRECPLPEGAECLGYPGISSA
jgi:hypothetical protein